MHESILTIAARLSDGALATRLKVLASHERESTVELLAHLAEFDHRKAYLAEGHGSLFRYCTAVLRLSEDAACNRIVAARAVRKFPVILDLLADGSVNLTTLRLLAQHLTEDNHRAVLKEATRRSNREVEVIVARLAPRRDVAPSIRKLPVPSAPAPAALHKELPPPSPRPTLETARPVAPLPVERPVVAPLSPGRYRIQFTVDKETHDELRRLQDLLRREIPNGDPGAIFARSLPLLRREVEKKKLGATSKPRRPRETNDGSRDIPAHVRRTVWKRDGGRCAFVGKSVRCTERRYLEWHHVKPHGHQGPATVENISLRCRAHNVFESELVFGRYDPSVVRETPAKYAVSGRIPSVPERITTPSSRVVRISA